MLFRSLVYSKKGLIVGYGGLGRLTRNSRALEICPTFVAGNAAWSGMTISQLDVRYPQLAAQWIDKVLRIGSDYASKPLRKVTKVTVPAFVRLVSDSARKKRAICFASDFSFWQ